MVMILITGATGHVGAELLAQLAASGHALRAMTRRPESLTAPAGVEVVRGDYDDQASLMAAASGADGVFCMSAQPVGAQPEPTHDLMLVEACRRAGVARIVKLSVLDGGGSGGRDPIARWHGRAEAAVRGSGAAWTLLRPGRFMSNALGWAAMVRRGDEVTMPFASRPSAAIDPADIATIAARALTEEGHAGKIYELSGPECLTPVEELAILGRELGRRLRAVPMPPEAARAGLLRHGMSEEVVDAVMKQTESDRGTRVLPTVAEVTGRPARSFAEWVRAHRGAFA
jgi:uncharacterized protein YbjT (DUF2867 family)